LLKAWNKMAPEKGTVPFCSADFAKSGQSPAILLDALSVDCCDFVGFIAGNSAISRRGLMSKVEPLDCRVPDIVQPYVADRPSSTRDLGTGGNAWAKLAPGRVVKLKRINRHSHEDGR